MSEINGNSILYFALSIYIYVLHRNYNFGRNEVPSGSQKANFERTTPHQTHMSFKFVSTQLDTSVQKNTFLLFKTCPQNKKQEERQMNLGKALIKYLTS